MAEYSWPKQRKLLRAPSIGFNAEVYRHFKDVDSSSGSATAGRRALRDSLLIGAKDSRTTAVTKIQYFRDQVQKVHLKPTIVGITKDELDSSISPKYKPQVILYFLQDIAAVPTDFTRIDARISYRLMDETSESLTMAKLRVLATQIKTEFAVSGGWTFNKGKFLTNYRDPERGYSFQIYGVSASEGEKVVKKVLSMRNHTFDEKLHSLSNPTRNSLNTPGNRRILGKTYKETRWRPNALVRFAYAEVILHGLPDPVCLVDRSGLKPNPLEVAI